MWEELSSCALVNLVMQVWWRQTKRYACCLYISIMWFWMSMVWKMHMKRAPCRTILRRTSLQFIQTMQIWNSVWILFLTDFDSPPPILPVNWEVRSLRVNRQIKSSDMVRSSELSNKDDQMVKSTLKANDETEDKECYPELGKFMYACCPMYPPKI
jgi:hypothetical protein